ncbi:hypothetical protein CEXT_169571 [Caerostris extrusa]|uniref:Uncharacterized protein n=1 Tax=Caerostris extrusa TaxID=172846 RepID=A0AAV4XL46_CAEEX|nr:hypothetical protein CEXT_169571 [Caerostris extrusa]
MAIPIDRYRSIFAFRSDGGHYSRRISERAELIWPTFVNKGGKECVPPFSKQRGEQELNGSVRASVRIRFRFTSHQISDILLHGICLSLSATQRHGHSDRSVPEHICISLRRMPELLPYFRAAESIRPTFVNKSGKECVPPFPKQSWKRSRMLNGSVRASDRRFDFEIVYLPSDFRLKKASYLHQLPR